MNRSRQSLTILIGIVVISVLVWLYLARHMPLRNFGWFCLSTAAFVALDLTLRKSLRKSLSDRIKENPLLGILLELVLGAVFVASFYWFAAYVYPGSR
jgi:hypothetical protein